MKVTVCRKEHFNAAHRLFNSEWSDEKNSEVFGKCNLPNYHGHNYNLIVKVSGEVDPKTGYVIDTKIMKQIIREKIIKKFDHQNLNLDVEEFGTLNPTAENIAIITWQILRKSISSVLDLKVVLFETERNFVEYSGE
jgi:6-pyruvoyltetrahydropterin/6-carboxytetrahydropterin synthase